MLLIFAIVAIIMFFSAVIVIFYVLLKPVAIPYLKAKINKTSLLVTATKDGKIKLIPAKYSSEIFTTSSLPFAYLQRLPTTYRFGDVTAAIVYDGWGVVTDPDMLEALNVLYDKGYTDYLSLERAIDSGELKLNDEIRIHAFRSISLGNLMDYTGDVSPSQIRAHIDEQIAKFVENQNLLGIGKPSGGLGGAAMPVILLLFLALIGAKVFGFV